MPHEHAHEHTHRTRGGHREGTFEKMWEKRPQKKVTKHPLCSYLIISPRKYSFKICRVMCDFNILFKNDFCLHRKKIMMQLSCFLAALSNITNYQMLNADLHFDEGWWTKNTTDNDAERLWLAQLFVISSF